MSAPAAPSSSDGTSVSRHVALVGLMGSGKTTVGRIVAERLNRRLIDTDDLVEQATGSTVFDLFSSRGEAAFRRYELDSVRRALARSDAAVIATGGGVVTIEDARALLAAEADVVWLRVAPEVLAGRLSNDSTRPLLGGRDPLEVLSELHDQRAALYEQVANVIVDSDGLDAVQVAERTLDLLGLAT